jgi:hypothetical protein
MQVAGSFEMLIGFYQNTQYHIPEERNLGFLQLTPANAGALHYCHWQV